MGKKALITGVSGQDGSYLADFLISKGYEVHGLIRRHSYSENQTTRIEHLRDNPAFILHYGDMTDMASLRTAIGDNKIDEIYNLAAQSHVKVSFDLPSYTNSANYIGFLNLLDVVRGIPELKGVKIYQASSSEMFGNTVNDDGFQNEDTAMNPVSPYGVSKLASYQIGRNYRRAYDMFISNGILFNHTSPRRGSNFVTAKVCKGVAEIHCGKRDSIELGNMFSSRDWGYAPDYVKAMWRMLNDASEPDDYVLASGETYTIEELCKAAFRSIAVMDYRKYVVTSERYKRAEDLTYLKGDSSKFNKAFPGSIHSLRFSDIIEEMVYYWVDKIKLEQ